MITIKVLKLGTVCRDKATQLTGTLTHWIMDMDERIDYMFQPKGLTDDCQPVSKLYLGAARLEVDRFSYESVEVPFEILGTEVESKASGYAGMATQFIRHINGCFHVVVQPAGLSPKTKGPVKQCDFDLRELTGKMIVQLSERELKESKAKTPSPTGDRFDRGLPGLD